MEENRKRKREYLFFTDLGEKQNKLGKGFRTICKENKQKY